MATKTRRKRARRGEGDKLREEILEVADRLLLEAGSESAVSIQAIADGVGCTPPAIYMHFADKDALMFEVCARHFERFVAALASATDEDEAADPLEVLSSRGRAYVQYGLDNPEPYRILFMQRAGESATGGLTLTAAESFKLLTDAVQECLDGGVFPEGDPYTVACALWASIHGLTSLMISNPDYPWPPLDDLLAVGMWASRGDDSAETTASTKKTPAAKNASPASAS
jgi:AcrR family transcriptional regulator